MIKIEIKTTTLERIVAVKSLTKLIVLASFVLVRENLISFINFLELILVPAPVRVIQRSKLAVCLF